MSKSEVTKNMIDEELSELQEIVLGMNPLELKQFRNSHDPDTMGFFGEEVSYED